MKHICAMVKACWAPLLVVCCFLLSPSFALADWNGQPYQAGQTLNPECAPTDQNCTVNFSSQWSTATSTASTTGGIYNPNYVGIGTDMPSASLDVQAGYLSNALTDATGTISDDGFGNVTGVDTQFTNGMSPGDIILYAVSGQNFSYTGVIETITDDTHMHVYHQNFPPLSSVYFSYQHPLINAGDQIGPGNNFTVYGYTASQAIGYANTVTGFFSTALGTNNTVFQNPQNWGSAELAMGTGNTVIGGGGIALGSNLVASSSNGIVIGSGLQLGSNTPLINNVDNSLMVGFNSNVPTLFVGGSRGANTTGNVNIGTTTIDAALGVSGPVSFTDGGKYYDPNVDGTSTMTQGLYAEWWDTQSDPRYPDYTIAPDATTIFDPTTDAYITRPESILAENLNARISGWVKADYSERYHFCSTSDDGSRVWVNNEEIVFNWNDQSATKGCGYIDLIAGKWYPFYVEYYQGDGSAQLTLSWYSNHINEEPIPLDHTINDGRFYDQPVYSGKTLTLNAISQTQKLLSAVNASGTEIVSIGTTTASALNVAGNINTTGAIYFNDGSSISTASEAGISQWSNTSSSSIYFGDNPGAQIGIGTGSSTITNAALTVVGPNTVSTIDGDQLIQNYSFNGSSPWSYDSDWYLTEGGIAHNPNAGGATNLEQEVSVIPGETYQIYIDMQDRTQGSIQVSLGGNYSPQTISDNHTSYNQPFTLTLQAGESGVFSIIPTRNFDGRIQSVFMYHASSSAPTISLLNSNGTLGVEIRTSSSMGTLNSAFFGNNAGAFSGGYGVLGEGYQAGQYNSGNYVTALGAGAARYNINNYVNAFGSWAAHSNSGARLNAFGESAGNYNSADNVNAMGTYAGYDNAGGYSNLFGYDAGYENTGYGLNAIGMWTAENNTGNYVNAMGRDSAQNNTGNSVDAIGRDSAQNNTGSNVTAVGESSAMVNTGNNVTAIGYGSLSDKSGGDGVVAIGPDDINSGWFRGEQNNISHSILIGPSSLTSVQSDSTTTIDNVIAIGGKATQSNEVVLGNSSTTQTLLNGFVAIGTTTPNAQLAVEGTHQLNFTKQSQFKYNSNPYTKDSVFVGNLLYVADYENGLQIFDVTDSAQPKLLSTTNIEGNANKIAVYGKLVFVAVSNLVQIFDVSDPQNVQYVSSAQTTGGVTSLVTAKGMLYVGENHNLDVYDITQLSAQNAVSPALLGYADVGDYIDSMRVINGKAYLATYGGMLIEDVSQINPGQNNTPTIIGNYPLNYSQRVWDVEVSGTVAYAVDLYENVFAFDVADPTAIRLISKIRLNTNVAQDNMHLTKSGDYLYISDGDPDSVYALYVADPANMQLAGHFTTTGNTYNVSAVGNRLYISDGSGGLYTVSVSIPQQTIASFTNGGVQIGAGTSTATLTVAGLGGTDGVKFVSQYYSPLWGSNSPTAVSGNYMYAKNNVGGIDIVDISDPKKSVLVGEYSNEVDVSSGPVIQGSYAYVDDQDGYIEVLDISNPKNAQFVTSYRSTTGSNHELSISGNYLYSVDNNNQIEVVNISNPTNPTYVSTIAPFDTSNSSAFTFYKVVGSTLYGIDVNTSHVEIINVQHPASPQLLGTYVASDGSPDELAVTGNSMFVGINGYHYTVDAVDISHPTDPVFKSTYNSVTGGLGNIITKGNFIFAETLNGSIEVVDGSDLSHLKYVSSLTSNYGGYHNPQIFGNYLYVLNNEDFIEILDVSNPQPAISAVFTGGRVGVGTVNPSAAFSVVGSGGDSPTLQSTYTSNYGPLTQVIASDKYMYGINNIAQMEIVDVSDPRNPSQVSMYQSPSYALSHIYVEQTTAYGLNASNQIEIIDVHDHAHPTYMSTVTASSGTFGYFAVKDNMLYAPDSSGTLEIYDVSSSTNPQFINSYTPNVPFNNTYPAVVLGDFIYMVNANGAVALVEIGDPNSVFLPTVVNPDSGTLVSFSVSGLGFLTISDSGNNLELFGVNTPFGPEHLFDISGNSTPYSDSYSPSQNGFIFYSQNCVLNTFDGNGPQYPYTKDIYTSPAGCIQSPYVDGTHAYAINSNGQVEILDVSSMNHPSSAATFENGRVGINTTNPLSLLDVNGNALLSGVGRYLNFGTSTLNGEFGYGFRDNNGVLQYKNANDENWTNIGGGGANLSSRNTQFGVGYDGMLYASDTNWGFEVCGTSDCRVGVGSDDFETRIKYFTNGTGDRRAGIFDSALNGYTIYSDSNLVPNIIIPNGHLGIGTTTPSDALVVSYDDPSSTAGGFTLFNANAGNWPAVISLGNPGEMSMISAGNGSAAFVIQAGGSGGVYLGGGATSWSSNSDLRLKTNIVDLSDVSGLDVASTTIVDMTSASTLDKVLALRPVSFNWIDPKMSTTTQIGFLAQDVLKIFPELVSVPTDPSKCAPGNDTANNCYGLSYDRFGVIAIAAIQDVAHIAGTFKTNLVAWFADATNGIDKLFAHEVHTNEICVTKKDRTEVCITGDQLQQVLTANGISSATTSNPTFQVTDGLATSSSTTTPNVPLIKSSSDATSTDSDDTVTTSGVEYSNGTGTSTTINDINTASTSQTTDSTTSGDDSTTTIAN